MVSSDFVVAAAAATTEATTGYSTVVESERNAAAELDEELLY